MTGQLDYPHTPHQIVRKAALGVTAMLAIGCGGHTVSSGGHTQAFAIKDLVFPAAGGKPMTGALSADGSTFAAAVQDSTHWYIWNKQDGWVDTQIPAQGSVISAPHLSADGKSLLVNTGNGPCLYANGSSAQLPSYYGATSPTAFAFSADGHRILGSTVYSGLRPDSGSLIQWTDGGSPVAVPGPLPVGGGTIGYLNPTGYAIDGVTPIGFTSVFTLMGPGMPHLQYASTLYWSIHDGRETDNPALSEAPGAVSPNGRTFASVFPSGGRVWDLVGSLRTFPITPPGNVNVVTTAVDEAGDVVAGGFIPPGGTISPWIWDAAHGVRALSDVLNANGLGGQFNEYATIYLVGLSADGQTFLLATTKSSGVNSFALVHLAGK